MTRKNKQNSINIHDGSTSETDHLAMYDIENQTKTKYLPKLRVKTYNNNIKFTIYYGTHCTERTTLVYEFEMQLHNGNQTLEFAFQNLTMI